MEAVDADVRSLEGKKSYPQALKLSLLANHFPALHGIRVLAIISVLQIHITHVMSESIPEANTLFTRVSFNVFFGMDLFFILSGFLIGIIVIHSCENTGVRGFGRFYLRRAFRTFPLYYVVLIFLALSLPSGSMQLENLASEFLYFTNYLDRPGKTSVMYWGWSLCVEEHFYLIIPFLMFVLAKLPSHRLRIAVLCGLWFCGLAVRLGIYLSFRDVWTYAQMDAVLYKTTHARFDVLVAGILLAYVQYYYAEKVATLLRDGRWRGLFYGISLASFLLLLFPKLFFNDRLFNVFAWGTITSLMFMPLIMVLIHCDGPAQRFLSKPFFRSIATLGYGIYLVHPPICWLLAIPTKAAVKHQIISYGNAWLMVLALLIVFSTVCAYVLHLLVEKPMLKLRDKVAP